MTWAYYNEFDAQKGAWLQELIKANVIAPGEVDERSITEISPEDLRGFRQCHFFAGIGVWSYALRLAGWPDDRECWTGSCPCQPFSAAGKRAQFDDKRHLWPEWFRLIRECHPKDIIGEQVGSAINGITDEDADVQALQGREVLLRVLYELQRQSPVSMQGMCSGEGAWVQALTSGAYGREISGMEESKTRLRPRKRGKVSRQGERRSIQSGPGGDSGADRPWTLRSNGDAIRSYQASLLECAVAGPNQSEGWLHIRQRASDSLFLECDGERLGYPESRGSGKRDPRATYKTQRRINRTINGCFETEALRSWLDLIRRNLEAEGYAIGSSVLGAHSIGAPHIRQRLYFGAHAERDGGRADFARREAQGRIADGWDRATGVLPDSDGRLPSHRDLQRSGEQRLLAEDCGTGKREHSAEVRSEIGTRVHGEHDGMLAADGCELGIGEQSKRTRLERHSGYERNRNRPGWLDADTARSVAEAGATRGFWADCDWWYGRDGKYRPIESGLFPLAHGATNRVLKLRGYGDAIIPQLAAEFVGAYLEAIA